MGDKRTDPGQYYPGGKVVSQHGVAPPQIIVQWSDVQGKPQIAPLPDKYKDGDVKGKINEIVSKFATVMVAALIGWTACADITVQKKRKDQIYNDEQVVVDVSGDGVGMGTNAVIDIANATIATNPVVAAKLDGPAVAPTNIAEYAGKAADAKLTGIALTNRCTKAEIDAKLAGKLDATYDWQKIYWSKESGYLADIYIEAGRIVGSFGADFYTVGGNFNTIDGDVMIGDESNPTHRLSTKADLSMISATNPNFSNAVNAAVAPVDATKLMSADGNSYQTSDGGFYEKTGAVEYFELHMSTTGIDYMFEKDPGDGMFYCEDFEGDRSRLAFSGGYWRLFAYDGFGGWTQIESSSGDGTETKVVMGGGVFTFTKKSEQGGFEKTKQVAYTANISATDETFSNEVLKVQMLSLSTNITEEVYIAVTNACANLGIDPALIPGAGTTGTVGGFIVMLFAVVFWMRKKIFDNSGKVNDTFAGELLGKQVANVKANTVSLAAAYSETATYAVGDAVTHDGKLYKCAVAITTAEAWTSAHWTETTVATLWNNADTTSYGGQN